MTLTDRILVVVPALNEAGHIEACLHALLGGAEMGGVVCLVVDGGSTDGTQDIVQGLSAVFPRLKLLKNPARLQAAGVNLGAKEGPAGCDILIRCDVHADYPPNFLRQVAEALLRTGADSLVIPMDAVAQRKIGQSAWRRCFQRANAWIVDTPLGSGGSAHRGGRRSGLVAHGHHAGFRREKFLSLGGYDETFSHNEDAEYDARLAAVDGAIYLEANIRIGYYPRDTAKGLWRQYFGYGKGRARNMIKNNMYPRVRQIIPVFNLLLLLGSLLLLPFSLWGGLWFGLYGGLLGGVSCWMALRQRAVCGVLSGLALGVMHLAWGLGFLRGLWCSCWRYLLANSKEVS